MIRQIYELRWQYLTARYSDRWLLPSNHRYIQRNAIVVTGAITYLINLSGIPFPVEPAPATGIVLYIAHIGIDVFCEWSTAG